MRIGHAHVATVSRRRTIERHVQAIALYTLLFGIALALRPVVGEQAWMILQAGAGFAALFLLWKRLDWHGEEYVSFGAILLIAGFANRLLYAADVLIGGSRLFVWPVASDSPWSALAKGEWMTVAGTMLVVLAWRRSGGLEAAMRSQAPIARGNALGYWLLYALSVAIEYLRQMGFLFDTIAQLATITYASGLSAIVVLNDRGDSRMVVAIRTALMTLPLVFLALGSGMKEAVIVAFLPLMIVYWRRFPHVATRAALLGGMMLVAALITSFVSSYRDRVWIAGEQVSSWQVLEDLASGQSSGGSDLADQGLVRFIMRSNATYHRGWAVDLADEEGYIPGEIFGQLAFIFIPRFLWPDKPQIEPGQEQSARLFGEDYRASSTSSTAAGFFTALYMGGGFIAFFLGSVLIGWIVGVSHRLLARVGNAFSLSAFSWILLLYGLRLDDTWPIYAISSPVVSFMYAMAIGIAVLTLARLLQPRVAAHAGVGGVATGRERVGVSR